MITGASLHPHQHAHDGGADRIAYRPRREIHIERKQGGDHGQRAQADDCYSDHSLSLCGGRAEVARRSHKPQVVGSIPTPATSFVSCVSAALPGRLSSLNFGRRLPTQRAGLFREGVARAASRQLSPLRRAGTSRRVFASVLAGEAARGRALRFVVARPLVKSFPHFVNSVVRVRLVADDQHVTGAFCAERKRFFLFA